MGLRVGGLASGLDTSALIEAVLSLERRPLEFAQARKAELESERTLFGELGTKLSALRDAAAAIDNLSSSLSGASLEEEFLAFGATSSNEAVLAATAGSNASESTTEITVDSIAQAARRVTTGHASDESSIAVVGQSLFIDHGGEDPIFFVIPSEGASLRDLASLINTDVENGGRVRADLVFDGSAYRLVISGAETGSANDLSITTSIQGEGGAPFLDASLSVAASDAEFTAFGLPFTRTSNTVTDVIPGVTLDLVAAGTAIVQVTRDDEEIESKLQAFVDAYNEIVSFVLENARFDPELEAQDQAPLLGDSTLRDIESRLQRVLVDGYSFDANPFTSLAQIGVRFENDGRLALDAEALQSALSTDASSVSQLLSGDGVSDGAATAISRLIDDIVRNEPGAEEGQRILGVLPIRQEGFEPRIDELDRQIERLETRLAQREELLVQQFTQLETIVSRLQSQGGALDALALLNNNNNG